MTHFNLPELLIPLIKFSDRATWEKLYPSYKDLMESKEVIWLLQDYYKLPGKLTTFAEFLFEYDLHDPVYRKKLCISRDRMKLHAVNNNDFKLFKELYDIEQFIDNETLTSIGQHANPVFIEFVRRVKPKLLLNPEFGVGLVEGKHFKLLDDYMKTGGIKDTVIKYIARDGYFELVKMYYNRSYNSYILEGAAITYQLEIIDWVLAKGGIIPNDYSRIIYGALEGANLGLVAKYEDKAGRFDRRVLLKSALSGGHLGSVKWVMSKLGNDEKLREEIIDRAVENNKLHIIQFFVSNYPELIYYAFSDAAVSGNLEILSWFFTEYEITDDIIMKALSEYTFINECAKRYLKLQLKDKTLAI